MRTIIPVLILDLHYSSLQIARSLGKKGIPIFGIDMEKKTIAEYSHYIKRIHSPKKEEQLKDYLIDFAKKMGKRLVIIPMSDQYILFLLKYF